SGQYPRKSAMHDLGAHFPNATGHPYGKDEYMPVEECGNILIMGLALANSMKYGTGMSDIWKARHIEPDVLLSSTARDIPDSVPKRVSERATLNIHAESSSLFVADENIFPLSVTIVDDTPLMDEAMTSQASKQAERWINRSYWL